MNSSTLPGRKFTALNLIRLGIKKSIITKATGLSSSTIYQLSKKRPLNFERKSRRTKITSEMNNFLKVFFRRHSTYMGGSLGKATQRLNEEFGTTIKSTKPVRNWLKQNKYQAKNKIIVDPFPRRIVMKRLAFAKKFVKDKSISKKILFTDEKTFHVRTKHHKNDKMWVQGKKNAVQTGIYFNNEYVKISAGISVFGKTELIFLPSKFNGKVYAEQVLPVFKNEVEKQKLKYFMQDNSKIHFEETYCKPKLNEFENILDWPARSPDLNPIENLWSYLSYKIKNRNFENQRQLKMILREEYSKIPQSIIFNLCNSFHSRLVKCIEEKGQMI